MGLPQVDSTTKQLVAFLNEGESITWATRHQLLDMACEFIIPRKKMAIFTAVLVLSLAVIDISIFFHGPLNVPFLDALVGPTLNLLFHSKEYGSFPGSFFGFAQALLAMSMAFLAVYWLLSLLNHELKLFAAWKAEKAAL
jgi:hypothetical protein